MTRFFGQVGTAPMYLYSGDNDGGATFDGYVSPTTTQYTQAVLELDSSLQVAYKVAATGVGYLDVLGYWDER